MKPLRSLRSADLHRTGLFVALAVAALLRFWALSAGVPFAVGVDEPQVMERATQMMRTGDLNPHFFDYPALYIYVEAAASVVRFLFGAVRGDWSSLAQATTEHFYVWGRAVTAMLGTASVLVLYRAGLRWGRPVALLAAMMFAVMPLHVRESHFALTDVPVTFGVLVALLLTLRAIEKPTVRSFALAGAAAGLAGATKYNGIVAVIMPLTAAAMSPRLRPSRLFAMMWIVLGMLAGFLIAAPYTVLDLPTFLDQFARLSSEYRQHGVGAEPVWLTYVKHLRIALSWPGSALAAGGIALGLFRIAAGPERAKWMVATIFPLAYFRFISGQHLVFARYLLPLTPFLSLMAAAAIVWTLERLQAVAAPRPVRAAAAIGLTLIAIAPPAYTSIRFDANAAKIWTTEQAYRWVMRELPPGTVVWSETRAFVLPPAIKARYVRELRLDGADFASAGVAYLVASSQNFGQYMSDCTSFAGECAGYQRVFDQTSEVARFAPTRDHPGPEIRILKVTR